MHYVFIQDLHPVALDQCVWLEQIRASAFPEHTPLSLRVLNPICCLLEPGKTPTKGRQGNPNPRPGGETGSGAGSAEPSRRRRCRQVALLTRGPARARPVNSRGAFPRGAALLEPPPPSPRLSCGPGKPDSRHRQRFRRGPARHHATLDTVFENQRLRALSRVLRARRTSLTDE